jgi:hypothetical protein
MQERLQLTLDYTFKYNALLDAKKNVIEGVSNRWGKKVVLFPGYIERKIGESIEKQIFSWYNRIILIKKCMSYHERS